MTIVKYILVAIVLLTLYITEPLWRVTATTDTTELSNIEEEYNTNEDKQKNIISNEAKKIIKQEEDIGPKPLVAYQSRVPEPLQKYWDKRLKQGESVFEDICSRLRATDRGWTTTCQYKIKYENGSCSSLQVDTFIIKHGKVKKE